MPKKIHPVDKYVGRQIRNRRVSLKISQETLAKSIGVLFQQVQKYEAGANRTSASKLYEISKVLQTQPAIFFNGVEDIFHKSNSINKAVGVSKEDMELFILLKKIDPITKQILLHIFKTSFEKINGGRKSCQ